MLSTTSPSAMRRRLDELKRRQSETTVDPAVRRPPPWEGDGLPQPTGPGSGPTPSYPILTEEVGYPPSPLANGASTSARSAGAARGATLGPMVTKALQDVLGWKIKTEDAAGFLGALNQSFKLDMVEGAVVSRWTPRSYVVQSDLSGGLSGAQASIYTMAKTTLDQMLPLIDGLYPLDPASDAADVAALRQLATTQLNNLVAEIGYLSGPRVMRVHQYFRMLLGVDLRLTHLATTPSIALHHQSPPGGSPLAELFPIWATGGLPPQANYWTNPDMVLGSLGDLRDELGLFETIGPTYVNTVADEQNVTNFRIILDYANAVLNAWMNAIQFFAGTTSPFLGTQLVIISRQLGVISEVVDEVRFVLDSVFIGPSQRETQQLLFQNIPGAPHAVTSLPPIYLEDLLQWTQNFVGAEAQDVIQNGGKLGLGEDFIEMIYQLCTQAYGLYLYAQHRTHEAIGTVRVQESIHKLVRQLWDLYRFAAPIGVSYTAPRP